MQFKIIFNSILLFSLAAYAVNLPLPSGPKNVTFTTGPLVDKTRLDPYAPSPKPRALMVSVFQPADCLATTTVDYMPNLTATYDTTALGSMGWPANVSFTQFKQQVCPNDQSTTIDHDAPLILFSPGFGAPRQLYNNIAASVASYGFTVLTMDHTYEPPVVEFPGPNPIYQNVNTIPQPSESMYGNETTIFNVHLRAADAASILTLLSDPAVVADLLPARGLNAFDTCRAGMFGHSLGGATAAQLMINDTRLAAGVNFDGSLFGDATATGLARPFMLFGKTRNLTMDNLTMDDWSWVEAWPKFSSYKREFMLGHSTHDSFFDAALALQSAGIDTTTGPIAQIAGTIEPRVAVDSVAKYVAAFFETTLLGKSEPIMDAPSKDYPEVTIVRQG